MTDSPHQEAKRALRKEVLARLRAQSPEARRSASAAIHERLFAWEPFRRARGVHCYLSLPEEVDTAPVLARCAREGKTVFVPYVIAEEGRLGLARWSAEMPRVTGRLGVPEPAPEVRIAAAPETAAFARIAAELDLVIVPGVAFDRAGGRLGHGKGYYDRFLAALAEARRDPDAPPAARLPRRAALAYAVQLVGEVPLEPWDLRMDTIITPDAGIDVIA